MNPKYIRIFSDIHLDFDITNKMKNFKPSDIWQPNTLETDKETILILAGDLWHSKKPFAFAGFSWMKNISEKFHTVIVLLGNHDFWGGNLKNEYDFYTAKIKEQNLNNVYLIQNNTLIIDDIKFVGGTLWTNFNNLDEGTLDLAANYMNDYKYIKNGVGFSRLKPFHILNEFNKTLNYIKSNITLDYPEQKLWVLTHHAPSFKSISKEYEDISYFEQTGLYASNLEYLMEENNNISVWVHGHCHNLNYYKINETRVISNPRGYTYEHTQFLTDSIFDKKGNLI